MRVWFVSLFVLALRGFAAPGDPIVLNTTNLQVLYEIDVSQRGTELLSVFNLLHAEQQRSPPNLFNPPLIEMQTTLPQGIPYAGYQGIYQNGIIPYIQNITGTPHNTLLLVTYITPRYSLQYPFYVVLPVEQVTTLLYFRDIYKLPSPSVSPSVEQAPPFVATFPPRVTPYYTVNPAHRAADIVSMVTQLRNLFTAPNLNQVWIQTGVNGPYTDPSTPNGLLENVLSAAVVGNGLVEIRFRPSDQRPQNTGTVYVSAEQVQQILFIRYWYNETAP